MYRDIRHILQAVLDVVTTQSSVWLHCNGCSASLLQISETEDAKNKPLTINRPYQVLSIPNAPFTWGSLLYWLERVEHSVGMLSSNDGIYVRRWSPAVEWIRLRPIAANCLWTSREAEGNSRRLKCTEKWQDFRPVMTDHPPAVQFVRKVYSSTLLLIYVKKECDPHILAVDRWDVIATALYRSVIKHRPSKARKIEKFWMTQGDLKKASKK